MVAVLVVVVVVEVIFSGVGPQVNPFLGLLGFCLLWWLSLHQR